MPRSPDSPERKDRPLQVSCEAERRNEAPVSAAEEGGPLGLQVHALNPQLPTEERSTGAPQPPIEPSSGAPEHRLKAEHRSTGTKPEANWASRRGKETLRGRVPAQKLEKYKRFQQIIRRDMEKLIEEAMDDLLVKYSFAPAAEHRSTALINDLDLSNKDNSDQLLLKGGAPEHRSPAQLKEEEVMAYYTAITRNDLRQRDRTAYRSGFTDRHGTHRPGVADVPLHIICYGIRETVISWVGRVNSFAFCLLKIHEFNNEGAAPEMAQYSERTFSIRLEVKNSPRMDPEELSLKLRTAARGTQALPMVGADLVEINASKKEPPAAPVVISPEPAAIAAWSKVLRVVRGKVAPRIFLTWFEPLRAQAVTGGVITVNVVSSTVSNWIDSQYGTVLKEAIREAGLAGIEWVFRNEQQSTGTGG